MMKKADLRRELDMHLLGEAMISDEAVKVLRELCDTFGNRFAGSTGERRAGDYLLTKMKDYGLAKVHTEAFRLLSWKRGRRPSLRVMGPHPHSFPAIALPYSPATPKGGLELELLSLGEGMPEDFTRRRREIAGKAVLVTSGSPSYYHRWVHRAEKYARAVEAGARAFIFMNHYDGMLEPTGALRFNRRAEIPGLGIARETGLHMLRIARDGPVSVHIETFDRPVRARSRNIVGDLTGTKHPDEMILVCAHYDGHDISQAGADNGSGVATILETARLLAQRWASLERTVRFACFGAEEIGLIGANAYADRHADELAKIRLVVNVDCIGSTRGKGFDFHGWDKAKKPLQDMAGEMREAIGFASRPNPYSDHFPFLTRGIPNCSLGSLGGGGGRGYGHTAADTFDKVNRADLREAAALLTRCLVRFANDRAWKLRRKSKAQVRRMLERFELISVMKAEGTLPDVLK
jgi:Zn-dependent M28 family amino/carboxypeptidase